MGWGGVGWDDNNDDHLFKKLSIYYFSGISYLICCHILVITSNVVSRPILLLLENCNNRC